MFKGYTLEFFEMTTQSISPSVLTPIPQVKYAYLLTIRDVPKKKEEQSCEYLLYAHHFIQKNNKRMEKQK